MTGPGIGKILVDDAKCFLICRDDRVELEDAEIYIHIRGYSYARVTHLDIEHPLLNEIISPRKGFFLKIINYNDIIKIVLDQYKQLRYRDKICTVLYIEILSSVFKNLIYPRKYIVTWVGGKYGEVYIGFKREQIKKLEYIVREIYGFQG